MRCVAHDGDYPKGKGAIASGHKCWPASERDREHVWAAPAGRGTRQEEPQRVRCRRILVADVAGLLSSVVGRALVKWNKPSGDHTRGRLRCDIMAKQDGDTDAEPANQQRARCATSVYTEHGIKTSRENRRQGKPDIRNSRNTIAKCTSRQPQITLSICSKHNRR